MMRAWVICFLILCGAVEFYQWFEGSALPLPVFAVGGLLLAVISNYDQPAGLPWRSRAVTDQAQPPQAASPLPDRIASPVAPPVAAPRALPEPQLPVLDMPFQKRSVSFTVRKSASSQNPSEQK